MSVVLYGLFKGYYLKKEENAKKKKKKKICDSLPIIILERMQHEWYFKLSKDFQLKNNIYIYIYYNIIILNLLVYDI